MTNDALPGAGGQAVRDPGRVAVSAPIQEATARPAGWRAILALPLLRRSVILSEIIGPPRGLKDWGE